MQNAPLTIIRVFNAPRPVVFKAWTESEHLGRWWGPKDFTNVIHVWDAQPGGEILLDMVAPDTRVYPMTGTFKQIVEPELLVFTSAALDADDKPLFEVLNTVSFSGENGKTKVTIHTVPSNIRPEAAPHLAGQEIGWNQSLDRLEQQLAKNFM